MSMSSRWSEKVIDLSPEPELNWWEDKFQAEKSCADDSHVVSVDSHLLWESEPFPTWARLLRRCERTSRGLVRMRSSRAPRRVFHRLAEMAWIPGVCLWHYCLWWESKTWCVRWRDVGKAAAVQTWLPAACLGVNVHRSSEQLRLLPGALCSANVLFHTADTRFNPNLSAALELRCNEMSSWGVPRNNSILTHGNGEGRGTRQRHLWGFVTVNYFRNVAAPGVTGAWFSREKPQIILLQGCRWRVWWRH